MNLRIDRWKTVYIPTQWFWGPMMSYVHLPGSMGEFVTCPPPLQQLPSKHRMDIQPLPPEIAADLVTRIVFRDADFRAHAVELP